MGVVFEATHLELRQRVALKVLAPERRCQPAAVERFLREARAASMLRSHHVARVFDVGTLDGDQPYMVCEYLEGEDLLRRLERSGPLPVAEAVSFLLQVCEGLAEAHGAGLVHRDIKPSNLFCAQGPDGAPLIKVLDFGVTKVEDPDDGVLTTNASLLGSPVYMAPEQFVDAHEVDARADVWSLGIVLYELVTGALPFVASRLPALCGAIARQPPVPPGHLRPDLPPFVEQAILRCLAKEPEGRFQNVAQLAAALAAADPGWQLAARRCARILEFGPKPSLPPEPPPARLLESWPATAYDPVGSSGARQREPRAGRSAALGGVLAAVGLSVALVLWMAQLVRQPGPHTAPSASAAPSARAVPSAGAVPSALAKGSPAAPPALAAPDPAPSEPATPAELKVWVVAGEAAGPVSEAADTQRAAPQGPDSPSQLPAAKPAAPGTSSPTPAPLRAPQPSGSTSSPLAAPRPTRIRTLDPSPYDEPGHAAAPTAPAVSPPRD
jgi:serine/threonine-protein kinase